MNKQVVKTQSQMPTPKNAKGCDPYAVKKTPTTATHVVRKGYTSRQDTVKPDGM